LPYVPLFIEERLISETEKTAFIFAFESIMNFSVATASGGDNFITNFDYFVRNFKSLIIETHPHDVFLELMIKSFVFD
jgi:hypothetical protein